MESLIAQPESTPTSLDNESHFKIPRKPVNNDSNPGQRPNSPNYLYARLEGDSNQPDSEDRRKGWNIWHDWWIELLCCLLVVSALMAIVGIIYPYQHKELPKWPYSISINTLISIFTTIMKSSMLLVVAEGLSYLKWTWLEAHRPLQDLSTYDAASRGPLGAIKLLISLRGRGTIASVGALLTLLSLAIEPATQQVVHYYPCSLTSTEAQASISRTNSYSTLGGSRIGAGLWAMGEGDQSSLNVGVFSPGSVKVESKCPTGSCDFSVPYHSVGFCSKCTDITQDLSSTNTTTPTLWTYSLPSGNSLYSGYLHINDQYGSTNFIIAPHPTTSTFEIITIPRLVDSYVTLCNGTDVSFGCNGVGAASCSLQPCVNTYSAAVRNGSLVETSASTWHPLRTGLSYVTTVDVSCLSGSEHQTLTEAGWMIQPGDTWLDCVLSSNNTGFGVSNGPWFMYYNDSETYRNTNKTISAACVYSVTDFLLRSLGYFLESFLNGNTSMTGGEDAAVGPSVVESIKYAVNNNISDWYVGNLSFDRVQDVFSNITESYSAYIRANGDVNASRWATGYVNYDTTCVQIRWAWLTFATILVLLTLLFFVAMIYRAYSSDDHRDWKSSPSPMLFHGFEKDAADMHKTRALKRVKDMEEYARELRVRLTPTADGWLLGSGHIEPISKAPDHHKRGVSKLWRD